MMTDEKIKEIASSYIRAIGDHWCYEHGIPQDDINEFARDVERWVLQNIGKRLVICDCYPKHCEHGDTCWCEPRVEIFENGNKLIIHNEAN